MGDRHHRHPCIALDHRASTPGVDGCSCLRRRQGRHRRGRTVRPEPHWHLGHPPRRGHPRRGSRLRAVHAGGSRRRAAVPTARGGHLQASFGPSLRLWPTRSGCRWTSMSECRFRSTGWRQFPRDTTRTERSTRCPSSAPPSRASVPPWTCPRSWPKWPTENLILLSREYKLPETYLSLTRWAGR